MTNLVQYHIFSSNSTDKVGKVGFLLIAIISNIGMRKMASESAGMLAAGVYVIAN